MVHTDGHVGAVAHDPQVDGVEGQLGQNSGQNARDAHFCVQNSGDSSGDAAGDQGSHQGDGGGDAADDHDRGHRAPGAQGAVYRQVRKVQDFIGDVHPQRHQAPDQALGYGVRHLGQERGEKVHGWFLLLQDLKTCAYFTYCCMDSGMVMPSSSATLWLMVMSMSSTDMTPMGMEAGSAPLTRIS